MRIRILGSMLLAGLVAVSAAAQDDQAWDVTVGPPTAEQAAAIAAEPPAFRITVEMGTAARATRAYVLCTDAAGEPATGCGTGHGDERPRWSVVYCTKTGCAYDYPFRVLAVWSRHSLSVVSMIRFDTRPRGRYSIVWWNGQTDPTLSRSASASVHRGPLSLPPLFPPRAGEDEGQRR